MNKSAQRELAIENTLKKLSEKEKVWHLAESAKSAVRLLKASEKKMLVEANSPLTSRARQTTLTANAWKARLSFEKKINEIKAILKYI